jgi:hypothetical protein
LGAAAQRGGFFLDLAIEGDEFLGEIEQAGNLADRKAFYPQQMTMAEDE